MLQQQQQLMDAALAKQRQQFGRERVSDARPAAPAILTAREKAAHVYVRLVSSLFILSCVIDVDFPYCTVWHMPALHA